VTEQPPRYQFGEFTWDRAAACLRRGPAEVDLPPKAFQVLGYLIEHRERAVPKQELVEAIWKDTFVTDDALVQAVTAARRALGDDPDNPRFIRTRARVGYQFIAPLEQSGAPPDSQAASVWVAPVSRRVARRLFVAIQAGYLLLYGIALYFIGDAAGVLGHLVGGSLAGLVIVVFMALAGTALRLYLGATVSFDHPQTAAKFSRLFPVLLAVDLLWALSPLLSAESTGHWEVLVAIPILAYGPFSQRTLIRTAYSPTGRASQPAYGDRS